MKKMIRSTKGFSLIELMIAVAILGIISAVAVPSYNQYILRSHRATAQAVLLENAQALERYYTANNAYPGTTASVTGSLTSTVSPKGATGRAIKYNIKVTDATASGYTLQAAPANGQTQDITCGILTLSNTGAQTPTTSGCW